MKYFGDLLNKIKRHISDYKDVHGQISFFSSTEDDWERFVREYNPVIKKYYELAFGRVDMEHTELAKQYFFIGKTQIAGFEIVVITGFYPNPDFNQKKWDEQIIHEITHHEFLKKKLGYLEQ